MENTTKTEVIKNKKFEMPHIYVILFCIILAVSLLTYVIPAGVYDRVEDAATGRDLIDISSFHYVEGSPTSLMGFAKALPLGLYEAASIVFLILIIGGTMQVITSTGALVAVIGRLAKTLRGREKLMVPMFLLLFAIGGATFGLSDEVCVFVPVGILLARALGFDAITGTAMVALGAASGVTAGIFCPFTVGVAQTIAELPLFSGAKFRIIALGIFLIVTWYYIARYANKVKKNPELSIVADLELQQKDQHIDISNIPTLERRHIFVALTFVAGLGCAIYGIVKLGWYIDELAAVYLAIGVIGGLVGMLSPNRIAEEFASGAGSIVFGALVVGMAKSISVIIQDAQIMDTIVHGLAAAISLLPKSITVLGMYFIQLILNFFITSGSGLAATAMPIMVPLADVLGITRQTAVVAFQFGDGFTNSIIPTSSELLAYLTIAGIPYTKWVKFIWPLMTAWIIIGAVLLMVANAINLGPF